MIDQPTPLMIGTVICIAIILLFLSYWYFKTYHIEKEGSDEIESEEKEDNKTNT